MDIDRWGRPDGSAESRDIFDPFLGCYIGRDRM